MCIAAPIGGLNRCECARKLAERGWFHNSFIAAACPAPEALTYPRHQLIANATIGVEPLLTATLHAGRVERRPIFDLRRMGAGQLQRLVMRGWRQRHDQIEIEPFQLVYLLEGDRLMAADVDADVVHDRAHE